MKHTSTIQHDASKSMTNRYRGWLRSLLICTLITGPLNSYAADGAPTSEFTLDEIESPSSTVTETVAEPELKDIKFSSLPGDRVQITLTLDGNVIEPNSFTVDEPARIALDFPDTKNRLPWRAKKIGMGMVKSIAAIEASDRTRVVINLVKQVSFTSQVTGNDVVLVLGTGTENVKSTVDVAGAAHGIEHIDFRRGDAGEGRVLVTFTDPNVVVDVREEGAKIVVDFLNSDLPEALQQRLDVIDFATPVKTVDTFVEGDNVRMIITPSGEYEHLAYQSDNTLTIDVKPIVKPKQPSAQKQEYKGEKLSLNFQDIEVRAVLQLLADFTGLNVVVSDTVQGNITLRLKNTPWDQALDIILKTKGLAMRQSGNVLLVAPSEEIAAREKLELEAQKQISELAPLRSELVQINYAKATALSDLLKSDKNTLLSERGNVTVDERTNTLLVRDTSDRLAEIRKLISNLDIPIRQVLIESRIVIASDNFAKDLGARVGITGSKTIKETRVMSSGSIQGPQGISSGTNTMVQNNGFDANSVPDAMNSLSGAPQRLNVNLPVTSSNAGRIALAILSPDSLLDLELSALQVEGRGEVVSNPRVITSNQKEAMIEQGTEIPYLEASSSGATSVSFKKAVLSLRVTPQITPDDRIILDLMVSKDSVGEIFNGVPSIDTKEVSTQVLVDNGETVVLGGIYEQVKSKEQSKIPFLGDIPLVGGLFRNTHAVNDKNELLIFVTPKILKESFKLQ